jgi:hypothetical protein
MTTRPYGLAAWQMWESYPEHFREQIIAAFCEGARFQMIQMASDPQWKYVENFNREYARCKHHLAYSNTVSPIVHEEVTKRLGSIRRTDPGQGHLI